MIIVYISIYINKKLIDFSGLLNSLDHNKININNIKQLPNCPATSGSPGGGSSWIVGWWRRSPSPPPCRTEAIRRRPPEPLRWMS